MGRTVIKQEPATDTGPAPIGHNRGGELHQLATSDFNDAIDNFKTANGTRLRARMKELIEAAGRAAEVKDEETAGRYTTAISQISAVEDEIKKIFEKVKRPYWDAGKAVDGLKNAMLAEIEPAKGKIKGFRDAYVREQERLRLKAESDARIAAARAEEARKQALRDAVAQDKEITPEMVAPVAVAHVPERTQVRGDLGGLASTRTVKVAVVEDWKKAAAACADDEKVREAVQAAANRRARSGISKITGCRIEDEIRVSDR